MEIHAAPKTQGLLMCQKPWKHLRMVTYIGIKASPTKKVVGSIAQLKCIYTNAHSMGNKQEELEAIVQQENYDIVAVTEIRWDDSPNWSAAGWL